MSNNELAFHIARESLYKKLENPVLASDGRVYERESIQRYFDKKNEDREVIVSPFKYIKDDDGKVILSPDAEEVKMEEELREVRSAEPPDGFKIVVSEDGTPWIVPLDDTSTVSGRSA